MRDIFSVHVPILSLCASLGVAVPFVLSLFPSLSIPLRSLPGIISQPLLCECAILVFYGAIFARWPRRALPWSLAAVGAISALSILLSLFPGLRAALSPALALTVCLCALGGSVAVFSALLGGGSSPDLVPSSDMALFAEGCLRELAILSLEVLSLLGWVGAVAALVPCGVILFSLIRRSLCSPQVFSTVLQDIPLGGEGFRRDYLPKATSPLATGAAPSSRKLFERCLQYLSENPSQVYSQYFLVNNLIKNLGTNRKALQRAVYTCWGGTPGDVLSAYRIQHAVDIWASGRKVTFERMSRECGYKSVERFLEEFSRVTGMSAEQWYLRNISSLREQSSPRKGEGER